MIDSIFARTKSPGAAEAGARGNFVECGMCVLVGKYQVCSVQKIDKHKN